MLQHAHEIPETETVDLLAIPAQRLQPAAIDLRATVREALETLRRERAEALYVTRTTVPGVRGYYGIVTRRDIENRYLG
ncbi:MAG: hypothetical protein U5L11_13595 [Arhodomonas sp.]|nr:hypothetical protein [Arhodomonas sp.]